MNKDWYKCTCIAINHDHKKNECDRQAKIRGGICVDCNYWWINHENKTE